MGFEAGDKVCLPNSAASHTVVGKDPRGHVVVHDQSTGQVRKVPETSLGSPAAQKAANDAHAAVVSNPNPKAADLEKLHGAAKAVRDSRPMAVHK